MANKQINKFECKTCNIFTTDEGSYNNHLLGSKHQIAVHTKLVNEKKKKCGIFVTGYPNQTTTEEEIVEFFTEYGKIYEYFISQDNTFAIIQYYEDEPVQRLLSTPVVFKGRTITVKPRVLKHKPEKNNENKTDFDYMKFMNPIWNYPVFSTQLMAFLREVELPQPVVYNVYNVLCTDLQNCLSVKFKNCTVYPFGSTISGLGLRNSDVDVYVQVNQPPDVCTSSESYASAYTKIAKKLLYKSQLFSNIIAIPHAQTPIVKCVHRQTGVSCDINFKNMLGVCNSYLIKFLLSLDMRLRPLLIIIKFWAKILEISGSGRLSNYGLTMMTIFYLQQPPTILPPVGILQTTEFFNFQEGWNGGFCNNSTFLPQTANKLTIPQLLQGFFNFYATFDHGFNVICPLTGKIQPKADFMEPNKLPPPFFHYKEMISKVAPLKISTAVCVQDPFELNRNICGYISSKQLDEFQKYCKIAADICAEAAQNQNTTLLQKLFIKQHLASEISDQKCTFTIPVGVSLMNLTKKENVETEEKVLRQHWFDKVNQFLISILSKVFLFEITVKKAIQESKSQKLSGQTDIHDNNIVDSLSFHCVGLHNVWDVRKSIAKTINYIKEESKTFIDQEISISEYIVNVICKGIKITEPVVDFNLTLNLKKNPTEAEFILLNVNSKNNSFKIMASFLAKKLPFWFEKNQKDEENIENKQKIEEKQQDKKLDETVEKQNLINTETTENTEK